MCINIIEDIGKTDIKLLLKALSRDKALWNVNYIISSNFPYFSFLLSHPHKKKETRKERRKEKGTKEKWLIFQSIYILNKVQESCFRQLRRTEKTSSISFFVLLNFFERVLFSNNQFLGAFCGICCPLYLFSFFTVKQQNNNVLSPKYQARNYLFYQNAKLFLLYCFFYTIQQPEPPRFRGKYFRV